MSFIHSSQTCVATLVYMYLMPVVNFFSLGPAPHDYVSTVMFIWKATLPKRASNSV